MKLLSPGIIGSKLRGDKRKKEKLSKRIEYRLLQELKEKLEVDLSTNDRVMIEVNMRVTGEFLNALNDKILSMYDYEQVDKNKFVFYNREISF